MAKKSSKAKYRDLSDGDHVIRHVKPKDLILDTKTGAMIGISMEAFRRRTDEEGLSVTSCEHFGAPRSTASLHSAVKAIRNSYAGVKPASVFAVGEVAKIKAQCLERGYKSTIKTHPSPKNPAHAEVRTYPTDDDLLFAALASGPWARYIANKSVP